MIKKQTVHFLFAPGPFGGAEQVILSGIQSLRSLGLNVRIIVIQEDRIPEHAQLFIERLESARIDFITVHTSKPFDWKLLAQLKTIKKDEKIKILHSHGIKAALYGTLIRKGINNFLITHHGNTSHTLKVRIYEWIELKCLKRCDQVISVSNAMTEKLNAHISNEKLTTITNLLSMEIQDYVSPKKDCVSFLYFGRLSPEKGLQDFLVALRNVQTPIELIILGTGNQELELKKYSQNLHQHHIQFMGFQNDVKTFLHKTNAVILPSHREGLPMTLIETVSTGVPILASNVGGIPELVTNGKNGILFPPKNSQEMTNAINEFIANIDSFTHNAKQIAASTQVKYGPKKWAQDHRKLYFN